MTSKTKYERLKKIIALHGNCVEIEFQCKNCPLESNCRKLSQSPKHRHQLALLVLDMAQKKLANLEKSAIENILLFKE